MRSRFLTCSLIAVLAATTGCAMCGSPFDYSYSAYGGRWQRDDPDCGRVGSLFDPAGSEPGTTGEPEVAPEKPKVEGDANEAPPKPEVPKPEDTPPNTADKAPAPGVLLH
jgi:hypothetical protein